MASKIYKFRGPIRWCKVFEENRDLEGFQGRAESFDGEYTIEQHLTEEQWDKLKKSGSQKQGKRNDPEWVKFTRKHKGPFKEASGAPRVVSEDNHIWDFEEMGGIGNDSIAEVTVVVYSTKSGLVGTRLEKVKVIEHKPYETSSLDEEQEELSKENNVKSSKEDSDEIPF